jgi:hypothetical protein
MKFTTTEDKYKGPKSVVLDLESLNAEYRNKLIEYRQAVANYVNYLKQDVNTDTNTNPNCDSWAARGECKKNPNYMLNLCAKACNVTKQQEMVHIKNATYWGTGPIGQNNSATVQECSASCARTTGCTGATFNATDFAKPMCWLRSGDTDITGGKDSEYAIVSKGKQLLMIVQKINMRLSDINQQIQMITNNNQETYDSQSPDRKTNMAELARQYIQLNEEREKINNTINDYQTLDQQQVEGDLTANKNYYSFVLLLILAIFTLFLLFKVGFSFTSQTTSSVLSGGAKGLKTIMSFRNK